MNYHLNIRGSYRVCFCELSPSIYLWAKHDVFTKPAFINAPKDIVTKAHADVG